MKNEQKDKFNASYDGIIENDNPLPRWWLTIFYLCVIFSIGYFAYYEIGPGKTLVEEYEAAAQSRRIMQMNTEMNQKDPSDSEWMALVSKPEHQSSGKAVFDSKCAVCHGNLGQGGIGPNLTDKFWIHGGKASQIYATLKNGVLDKGMPAWKGVLSNNELRDVTVYVVSLRGTNPPGAKEPQGTAEE
jgi:cytochrome c oxidase cbb3-type subunit 3